jgi:hypothetical protein
VHRLVHTLLLVASLVGVVGLLFVKLPGKGSILWQEIYNSGHGLLFAAIALVFLALSRVWLGGRVRERGAHYLVALVAVIVAGAGTEILQSFFGRSAEWADFGRDFLGGSGALGVAATFDDGARDMIAHARSRATRIYAVCGLLVCFATVPMVYVAHAHRDEVFPRIAAFDSYWGSWFVHTRDADTDLVARPAAWTRTGGERVTRAVYGTDDTYPNVEIIEPAPDWSRHTSLVVAVYSPQTAPIELKIRIHDRHHDDSFADRFNGTYQLAPGANQIRIPLEEVRRAPHGRAMDMTAIESVVLFLAEPKQTTTLYFADLRLE